MRQAVTFGAAFAVGCSALCADVVASDITTADVKPWMWEKLQQEKSSSSGNWNAGFNAGLECLTLLDLELDIKNERKTWGEMAEICRSRNNVADR